MVEKVKNALPALEDIVDENILDYCTLDKKVPNNLSYAVTVLEALPDFPMPTVISVSLGSELFADLPDSQK